MYVFAAAAAGTYRIRKGRKDMKKQIAFVAAFVMLITTMFSNSVFAAFSDVQDDNRYRNAIITLSKLSVIDGYDDGTFKPEGEITRAEFTKMLIAALGYGDNTTEPTEFDDVTDHWARHYIKTAYDMGIINGTGERTFEPDKPVTYEQALKMLVCTLGYEGYAIAAGGYPTGYVATANNDLALTTNIVNQANSDPAKRQVIAQAVYNSLEVNLLEKNQQGKMEKTDKTILKDYLDVMKVKGTLIGVEETKTNDCTVNLLNKQIAIKPIASNQNLGIIVVNLGSYADHSVGELAKMIGKEMTFYYYEGDDESERELKVLDYETTKNETKTVSYKKFAGCAGMAFKYTDGPSTKTLRIKDDATIIYNGQAVSDFPVTVTARYKDTTGASDQTVNNKSDLLSLWLGTNDEYCIRGDVQFTDAGADGTMDIVSINDYKVLLAYKAPTTSDYRLQNKLKTGDGINLDPNNINQKTYIEKNGKEIAATSIRANDVVSYTVSLDGSIVNVYVVDEKVTGTVSSINETEKLITIANNEYDLGEDCVKYIADNGGRQLTTGVEGTFYLDKLGTVIYGTIKDVQASPYAYITNVTTDDIESTAYVNVFMPSVSTSSTVTYSLAEKVRFNDGRTDDYNDVADKLSKIAESTNPDKNATGLYTTGVPQNIDYSQPVRLKVDTAAKQITEIYTVDTTTSEQNEDPTKLSRYKELKKYYYTGSNFKTSSSSSVDFAVNSKTTVLYVPRDRSDRSGYAKKTISNAFSSDNYYWVEAYDVNKSNVASLVILYGDTGSLNEITSKSDYAIVAKRAEDKYDAANDTTTSLISVYAGATTATKEWTALNKSEFADVQPGDVIQFAYDDDNKIQGRKNIIKFSDVQSVLNDTTGKTVAYDDETRTEIYNWNEEITQTAPEYQKYMFDYRYPKENLTGPVDNYYVEYTSSVLGKVPMSRVCIYNVYQLVEDANGTINKMYLTKEGFDASTGELRSADKISYDEVTVSSNTRFIRMENSPSGITFNAYAPDTTEAITARDLKDAQHYGSECSKVMVTSRYGGALLITVLPE